MSGGATQMEIRARISRYMDTAGFSTATRKGALKWARKVKLISATDPDLWGHTLLLCASIDAHKYNGLCKSLQRMKQELPPCPLPNEEYIKYDGERVCKDMTVEPGSADWVHCLEAHDAFIDQLIDACAVDDVNVAWSEYQRMRFRVTGVDGDPTEDDVTRFAMDVSNFHGRVPDPVSEDWPSSVVAEQTIANIAKAFTGVGKEAGVKAALKVDNASNGEGESNTWEAVL